MSLSPAPTGLLPSCSSVCGRGLGWRGGDMPVSLASARVWCGLTATPEVTVLGLGPLPWRSQSQTLLAALTQAVPLSPSGDTGT